MKVLHLLARGATGGIERLCEDFSDFSRHENTFVFVWGKNESTYLNMKNKGVDVFQLNAESKNLLNILKEIDNIRKQKQSQVVIVHHDAPLLYLYLIALKYTHANVKTIIYAHSDAVDMCSPNRKGVIIRKFILKAALQSVDRVVAISNSVKKSLVSYLNVKERKISIIYNGVNTKKFCSASHTFSNPLKIIYVGRLIEEKGVQITLNALAMLPADLNWKFQIVGDGNYRSALEAIAKSRAIAEKVEFLGTRADVPDLLQQADVFIHMPIWKEGFGIAVVEAMAAGLVCICADNGAMAEIISDEENGYLIEKENAQQLSDVLVRLMRTSQAEFQNLKSNAVATAMKFSMNEFCDGLDSLIACI